VRVNAASVSFGDLMARTFGNISAREFNMPAIFYFRRGMAFGWRKPKQPILGSAYAGVVEAVGADVTRFQPGDAVFGYRGPQMGAYANTCAWRKRGWWRTSRPA
jgi:NADPH:quinone reductase-like Zn-dependent oxidoreductase